MTAPFRDLSTATIGLALIGGVIAWAICSVPFAVLIGRTLARGPYIDSDWDDFDDHCDTTPGLDQMPLEDRMCITFAEQVEAYLKEVAS